MSVRIISRTQSMIENRKKFDQLSESSFFTYQDEAGVHLCIVKQRVNLDALLIFELSTSQNKKLLTTENFSDFNDSRVFTYYEFDPNHCLNLCNFAERGPTKDEMRITNERSKLESHYDNFKDQIWARESGTVNDHVILFLENGSVQCKYFSLHNLEAWPERPEIFIFEQRP